MKRNVILALFVILSLGVCFSADAQGRRKKKNNTSQTDADAAAAAARAAAAADSAAKASAADAAAKAAAAAAAAEPSLMPDSGHTDGLVADTSTLAAISYPLDSTRPVDGMYKIPLLRGAKPFAFPKPDRYNIKFYKRIWRVIDVRDSMNRIFAEPGATMIKLIMDAIKGGKLVAYKDEAFTARMTYNQALKAMSPDSQTVMLPDINGADSASITVRQDFNPDSVTMFELKEDIFFDKTRGRIITQIVGLSPLKKLETSSHEFIGYAHPFYLYFPQCRVPFASREIYDTQRDIYNVSYDDIFISHNFKSVIVQESNPAGLKIKDKYPGNEAMQKKEADRIEQEIINYKKNVWKY